MIMPNRLSDSNVPREKPPQTGLRTRTAREAEVSTGRDQLPPGTASKGNLSRRHTKQAKRQARPEGPRQPNHQLQWKEATVRQAHAVEEGNRAPQPGWNLDQLDHMTVPAFSALYANNGSAINS